MKKIKANIEAIQKAIDIVGGVKSLADKADVAYQSLLNWKAGRSSPSTLSCVKIEKATDGQVSRKDILPDFPWD